MFDHISNILKRIIAGNLYDLSSIRNPVLMMEQDKLLLLLFGLFVRLLGISIVGENLLKSSLRESRYLNFTFGWGLQFFSGICLFFLESNPNSTQSDFFLFGNIILHSMSDIYLLAGFISFIRPVQARIATVIVAASCILHLIFFHLGGLELARLLHILSLVFFATFFVVGGYKMRKNIGRLVGKESIWLFIPAVLVWGYAIIYLTSMMVYQKELLHYIIEDWFVVIILICVLVLVIFTENNMNLRNKDSLKDRYSHDLGNILQIILSSQDLLIEYKEVSTPETLLSWKIKLDKKWEEAMELLKEIRKI